MARTRASQASRERLLDAGVRLFAEQGFHGTGIRAVLLECKVPKGSFYNFFASKEAYAIEVLDRYTGRLLSLYDRGGEQSADAVGALRATHSMFIAHLARNEMRHGCVLGSLAGEVGGSSDEVREAVRLMVERWQERLVVLLRGGQRDGSVRGDLTAERLARRFWDGWQGALLRAQLERDATLLMPALDALVAELVAVDRGFEPGLAPVEG